MKIKPDKKRKNFSKVGALAATALISLTAVPQRAHAQLTILVDGTVNLNFGTVTVAPALAGTVVIDTAGGRSVTGGVTPIAGAGLETNAVLSITGSTGLPIDLTIPLAAYTVSNGGGQTMTVDSFNLVLPAGGATQTVTLATNTELFPIGATLRVSAGQAAGTYIGDFTVNANYQ